MFQNKIQVHVYTHQNTITDRSYEMFTAGGCMKFEKDDSQLLMRLFISHPQAQMLTHWERLSWKEYDLSFTLSWALDLVLERSHVQKWIRGILDSRGTVNDISSSKLLAHGFLQYLSASRRSVRHLVQELVNWREVVAPDLQPAGVSSPALLVLGLMMCWCWCANLMLS